MMALRTRNGDLDKMPRSSGALSRRKCLEAKAAKPRQRREKVLEGKAIFDDGIKSQEALHGPGNPSRLRFAFTPPHRLARNLGGAFQEQPLDMLHVDPDKVSTSERWGRWGAGRPDHWARRLVIGTFRI